MAKRKKIVIGDKDKARKIRIRTNPPTNEPKEIAPSKSFDRFLFKQSVPILVAILAILSVLLYFYLSEKPADVKEQGETLLLDSAISPFQDSSQYLFEPTDRSVSIEAYLEEMQVNQNNINLILQKTNELGIKAFQRGHKLTAITPKALPEEKKYFHYEMSIYEDLLITAYPIPDAEIISKTIEKRIAVKTGIIDPDHSLFDIATEKSIASDVLDQVAEAMKWSVDFFYLSDNFRFKVVYEELVAQGKVVDTRKVLAVLFEDEERDTAHYAFYYKGEDSRTYFDQNGRSLERQFLKSPVKYAVISSRYNLNRPHPVTGENKPHFGTDYAAPKGTPVLAVADGRISIQAFKRNNGNYIKIAHSNDIETQYLHLDGFAKGIKKGALVKQGDIIGYVGSTGLATGPHVCFRFWKKGKQIDHLKENLNFGSGKQVQSLEDFAKIKAPLLSRMERTSYYQSNN